MMTDYSLWQQILIVTITIIVHELGHYLMMKKYNLSPKIKFSWWGLYIKSDGLMAMTPKQIMIISFSGILAGYVWLILMLGIDTYWIFVYFLMCIIDIMSLIEMLRIKDKDSPYIDHMEKNIIKERRKLERWKKRNIWTRIH